MGSFSKAQIGGLIAKKGKKKCGSGLKKKIGRKDVFFSRRKGGGGMITRWSRQSV